MPLGPLRCTEMIWAWNFLAGNNKTSTRLEKETKTGSSMRLCSRHETGSSLKCCGVKDEVKCIPIGSEIGNGKEENAREVLRGAFFSLDEYICVFYRTFFYTNPGAVGAT